MSPFTLPLSVQTLERARILCSRYEPARILGSSCGLICLHGYHKDHSEMVVFWNPSIRKSVSVLLEPPVRLGMGTGWVGFGVCPETWDPKLVKIDNVGGKVHVYTLSTRAWKKVSVKSPYELYHLKAREGVCVEGFIYWLERDDRPPPFGNGSYCIVSFDLSNDEFGKVCLP
ncbi:ribonuclease H-like domain-containing protein, partial [Tanacetum coccineum]